MPTINTVHTKKGIGYTVQYYWKKKRFSEYFPPTLPNAKEQAIARASELKSDITLAKKGLKKFIPKVRTSKIIQLKNFAEWYKNIRKSDIENSIADTTLNRYTEAINLFSTITGPHLYVAEIQQHHITNFIRQLKQNGRNDGGVNIELRHLKHPFKTAYQYGLLPEKLQINQLKRSQKQLPDFLTPEELDKLYNALPEGQCKLAFMIMKWTGIRRTELVERCEKRHFDLNNESFTIIGKNREIRNVPLHPRLIEYLKSNEIFQSKKLNENLFTISLHWLTEAIWRAKRKAGINKRGSAHILRHSFGTFLINQDGFDLRDVQKMLGHKTLYMTTIYTQIHDKILKQKFQRTDY